MNKKNPSPSDHILRRRDYRGPAFLKQGFRPFFLGASVWSTVAMVIWMGSWWPSAQSLFEHLMPASMAWEFHIHEMLFGFLAAAIAGFLLTAVPNWTGRLPVRGTPLMILFIIWLLGRLAMLLASQLPFYLAATLDSLFLVSFTSLLAREIIAGKNWKNLAIVAIVGTLAVSNMAFHLISNDLLHILSLQEIAFAALLLAVLLMSLIGGRIVPSFTRNWMARNKIMPLPASRNRLDQLGSGLILIAVLALIVLPEKSLTGVLCLVTALVHLARLWRWRGFSTLSEPLVFILHIGFGWIGIGFALIGLSILTDNVPHLAALHAFSVGAIGTMILAVMTRASKGHTGRSLEADRGTLAIYALINLAAILRVAHALLDLAPLMGLLAGLAWIGAFLLFSVLYLPLFMEP